jgi:AraC-like DNA-binding protein
VLRRELALRYLQHDAEDLAFILGFSDASAFRRAFKRWTGSTRRELRKS